MSALSYHAVGIKEDLSFLSPKRVQKMGNWYLVWIGLGWIGLGWQVGSLGSGVMG